MITSKIQHTSSTYYYITTGVDWVDPHDPTVIAETELLSAANSIEAAAKKLASLQPMLKPKVGQISPFCVVIGNWTLFQLFNSWYSH